MDVIQPESSAYLCSPQSSSTIMHQVAWILHGSLSCITVDDNHPSLFMAFTLISHLTNMTVFIHTHTHTQNSHFFFDGLLLLQHSICNLPTHYFNTELLLLPPFSQVILPQSLLLQVATPQRDPEVINQMFHWERYEGKVGKKGK